MQRRSDQHAPRQDDELKHDAQSLLQGDPHESRSQPQRLQEEEEQAPSDDLDQRADLARLLRPSAFPATGQELVRAAAAEDAPDEVLERLQGLPANDTFVHFEEVWEALGGSTETRRGDE